jgi:3',5'-cyclic AMP phosphodiesterase CpdA
VVVLSGDITQRARPVQFRAAKLFVDRLGAPVLTIPGNHDIALFDLWARLTRPYARYAKVFGADLEPVHSTPDLLVVGVNTTRKWRHKNGEVSTAQIDRVAKLLTAASPQQLRMVVVHQPMAVTEARDRPDLLHGHPAALRTWAAAGADLVLGGHIHLPYTLAQQGLARRLWVVQAGTAVSWRTRPEVPNSVNILRWRETSGARGNQTQTEVRGGGVLPHRTMGLCAPRSSLRPHRGDTRAAGARLIARSRGGQCRSKHFHPLCLQTYIEKTDECISL